MAYESLYRGLSDAGENIARGVRHGTENTGRLMWHDIARKEEEADDIRNQKRLLNQDLAGLVKDITIRNDTERRQRENQSYRDKIAENQSAMAYIQQNPDLFPDAEGLLSVLNKNISGLATRNVKPELASVPINYTNAIAEYTKRQRAAETETSGLNAQLLQSRINETNAQAAEREANAALKESQAKDDNTIVYAGGKPIRLGDKKAMMDEMKTELSILKASGKVDGDPELINLGKRFEALRDAKTEEEVRAIGAGKKGLNASIMANFPVLSGTQAQPPSPLKLPDQVATQQQVAPSDTSLSPEEIEFLKRYQ